MILHIGDHKASQSINPCAPRILFRQKCLLRAQRYSFGVTIEATCKIDTSPAVTAANIEHPKPPLNIAQTSAMIEEIDLSLFRQFVPA